MLRTRLVAILAVLVLAGLAVSGFVTYRSLQSFLLHRVDGQLREAAEPVARALLQPNQSLPANALSADLPLSTYGEIRSSSGKVVVSGALGRYGQGTLKPQLPRSIGGGDVGRVFTTGAVDAPGALFRTLVARLDSPFGPTKSYVLVAIPLTDVTETLHRLLLVEVIVAVAVLAALAGAAWWMVRRELRPLEAMGDTATSIAGGDLARRVEPADETTEVGRLGLALNGMLARIESAMKARTASEDRLRRFLADASHELRTPLTSIRGYAELFRRGAAERPEDLEVSMRRIEEEAARMGVLVDDLLLLAHMDETRPAALKQVDLARLLRDAASDARAVAPNRTITTKVDGAVMVEGDEDRLRQAVGNLVGNAISHSPEGTQIDLSLGARGGEAEIKVADRGPGLDEEAAEHAFERFWRSEPNRDRGPGGSGLGLSIVEAISEVHGGRVTVANRDEGGAVFTVHLPLSAR